MDWYKKITMRLKKIQVSEDYIEELVEDICNSHGVSYINPAADAVSFIVYSALEQIYLDEIQNYADLPKMSVADGVTTDFSMASRRYSELASMYHDKAQEAKLESNSIDGFGIIEQTTSIQSSIYYAIEEEPLNVPVVRIVEGITQTHIIWDVDDSIILAKTEVFINESEEASYFTTSRYDTKFGTSETVTSVKVVKTDTYNRTVETEITL